MNIDTNFRQADIIPSFEEQSSFSFPEAQEVSTWENLEEKEFSEQSQLRRERDETAAADLLKEILAENKKADFLIESEKSFGPENDDQPVFLEIPSLSALAELAEKQRGGLGGDDRRQLMELGADPRLLRSDYRYLKVETKCEIDKRPAQKIWPPNISLHFEPLENGRYEPVVESGYTRVNYATLVIRDLSNRGEILGAIRGVPLETSEFGPEVAGQKMSIEAFRQRYGNEIVRIIKKEYKPEKKSAVTIFFETLFTNRRA